MKDVSKISQHSDRFAHQAKAQLAACLMALRHEQSNKGYNPSFRQLLHVGFKVAAKMGDRYLKALEANEGVVARNVTMNLFDRHIKPVFLGL